MALECGIVGLPNVGKSTIFSALTAAPAQAENFPFCTIDPNVGIVDLPDERLDFLASVFEPKKKTPATVKFVDIAGLIKGASQGEGLGNQFLANIRECSVIAHVVRCFDNPDIMHVRDDAKVEAGIDPESVGFNPEYLKAIPWLTKCKIFREEVGKPVINIPILCKDEAQVLWNLCTEAKYEIVNDLKELLTEFFRGKKQEIPAHLDSVPLQKQYLYADNAMLFATIREAISRGKLYDGNYDDDSNGVNQPPCPMVLVIG